MLQKKVTLFNLTKSSLYIEKPHIIDYRCLYLIY